MTDMRDFAVSVVRTLHDAGHAALFAGGCVRDELLGLRPKDYDVATSARPEQVRRLFRRTVAVGAAFGVVEVLGPGRLNVQVATFRSDGAYIDGRHPENVVFCSPEEDARRRDFTINGMFLDPLDGRLIDFVGGQADLRAGVLRAIGDPHERFREDRLRLLRAVRMAARFGLTIEPATRASVAQMAGQLGEGVSPERIADELRKMLLDRHRAAAVRMLLDLGLAAVVLPELTAAHHDHVVAIVEHLPGECGFPLAMAGLLHGYLGRKQASAIAVRLRLSNEERERIEWLIEKQRVLFDAPTMRPSRLKPLLVHPGIDELMALARADVAAEGRSPEPVDDATAKRRRWAEAGELDPPPLLTGNDLLDMGLTPGPRFKTLLQRVRDGQLDGEIRTREEALATVQASLAGAAGAQ